MTTDTVAVTSVAAAAEWPRRVADQVSESEMVVLDALERLGPLDETQVASSTRLSPSATTAALTRLQHLGFVECSSHDPECFVLPIA